MTDDDFWDNRFHACALAVGAARAATVVAVGDTPASGLSSTPWWA